MRSIRYKVACRALAAAAMVLMVGWVGTSAAKAGAVWVAPDLTVDTPASAAVVDYTLQICNTPPIHSFTFSVQLVQTSGSGSLTFGTAFEPASNFIFSGPHSAWYNIPAGTSSTMVSASSSLISGSESSILLNDLATIPLSISAGTVGTWEVQWIPASTSVQDINSVDLPNGAFATGLITVSDPAAVPEPLAAWGGLLLLGIGARWQMKMKRKNSKKTPMLAQA